MAVTWSLAFALLFGVIWGAVAIVDPDSIDPGEGIGRVIWIGGIVGLVAGAVFAVLLSIANRRRTIGELSIAGAALLGFVGAAAFPLLTTASDGMVVILAPVGAALAAGSVAIAKRAALRGETEAPTLPR